MALPSRTSGSAPRSCWGRPPRPSEPGSTRSVVATTWHVTFKGKAFTTDSARLYLRTKRRPPVYLSAFGPEAAEIAGRLADGIWTLADPQKAPSVIASYRRAAD
jgi:alkanesulfonate monooxygenase SsuD/methylene tetrahydromethanopterin reductase-like flavin-dependent oxidoreductase (luciferase family)